MSSAYSTITSNVNLLLVNSSTITNFAPYIAYISSVSIPGRIATVRDAVGLVSSPGRLIILSTLKDVIFSDGTSSITISQPFGYISLSSRDKNTWDVINTFAFPQPSPVSYVSSVYATAGINANSILARSYISTANLTVDSISSINIQASTISTGLLLANRISTNSLFSFNSFLRNISSQTISTTNLFASLLSTNRVTTNDIGTSTVSFNSGVQNSVLSLSNDGQALLLNGIPTGTYKSISSATTNLNMNNFSISNVDNINTTNLAVTNMVATNLSSINLAATDIFTDSLQVNNISTNNINTSSLRLYDAFSNQYIYPIFASNNSIIIKPNIVLVDSNDNTGIFDLSANSFYMSKGLYMNNSLTIGVNGYPSYIDLMNGDMSNINELSFTNLTSNITSFNNVLAIPATINLSNNEIINILQTSTITSAATNLVTPFYFKFDNKATNTLIYSTWSQALASQPTFSFNSNFFKISGVAKFNFNFTSEVSVPYPTYFDVSNGAISFYYTLYNSTRSLEYIGDTFTSQYPITVIPFPKNSKVYTFSYEDIFDFSTGGTSNGDTYYLKLYANFSFHTTPALMPGDTNTFTTDNHTITFQPIQPA